MNPVDELKMLKHYIKLSDNEAVKRDCLESFIDSDEYEVLLDADSILFSVCHYGLKNGYSTEQMVEDFYTQRNSIVSRIDETFQVEEIYYYFTTCKNNFRIELSSIYKANREQNELTKAVADLKKEIICDLLLYDLNVFYSDTLEADDLIMHHARSSSSIICSIDKDLKQITGCHFDYYKQKTGEVDVYGTPVKDYKGFSFTSPTEGTELLGILMLVGDAADNIKGVKGIGKVKAKKLLNERSEYGKFRAVTESYIKEGGDWKDKLEVNYKLINLIK